MSSDQDLLRSAREGNEKALGELLMRCSHDLRGSLAGKIPKRWQSMLTDDDILQQTFTDAFQDIRRFVPCGPGAFLSWLKTLARNNLQDAVRMLEAEKRGGNRKRVASAGSDSFELLYDRLLEETRSTPSRHAARNEAAAALKAALAVLPEAYRRVIRMYDFENRPVDEVASAMNRSPGAVFLLRNRALRRLQEFLGRESKFFSDSP